MGWVLGTWAWSGLGSAVGAAADLVLPSRCAACPAPQGPLCPSCRAEVRAAGFVGGPRRVGPTPPTPGMPACWSAVRLVGPVRTAVTAFKDQDRRDLGPVLGALLAAALASALASDQALRRAVVGGSRVLVVPMPTSPSSGRRRGDDPVGSMTRRAVDLVGTGGRSAPLVLAPAVRHARAVADQSGLGRAARADNLSGALTLHPAWRVAVAGVPCVLCDDVVTTGASLTEAARVLRAAGAREVLAATVAATMRHGEGVDPRRHSLPLVAPWVPG